MAVLAATATHAQTGLATELSAIDAYLAAGEAAYADLVPGAEKRVLWLDGQRRRRAWAVVYLHGYSATRQETAPLCELLARDLGANLFETRLTGHGRGDDAMPDGTVTAWQDDVREAMHIAGLIGERILLVSVSTGGTLATWWALSSEQPQADVMVMISPNFMPRTRRIFMIDWPVVGPLLLRFALDEYRSWTPDNAMQAKYWTHRYPMRALVELVRLVKLVDAMDKAAVTEPTLMLYSPMDEVIDTEAVEQTFARWGGAPKRLRVVNQAEDPAHHVLAGDILSPRGTAAVLAEIKAFVDELDSPPASIGQRRAGATAQP